eukprot:CAMPEP_0181334810 /NCGR_PEP_ID=MMETSP1101-20121128/26474_1 /TAXON_ID=46948 /ORGANISM="Rhodomonas abbreviata, Strain Caron Lab Isolate" /LENGTH=288 /DNA_ID=CAMNT_0023444843 /DNA_START=246 /DNA_END=1108 /DNA_ORIENTATION=-
MNAEAKDSRSSYDNLRDVFKKFDADNSGHLDKNELPDALDALGILFSQEELSETMMEMDTNGDGEVDLEEFERAVCRLQATKDVLLSADEMTLSGSGSLQWLREIVRPFDEMKEDARKGRRTIFNDFDWQKYRSSFRIIDNTFGSSVFLVGLWFELCLVVSVSVFVLGYNHLVDTDIIPKLVGHGHLSIPILPFTLTAPAIGLLLVFRNNAAYARYTAAREQWGKVCDSSRDLVRSGLVWCKTEEDKEELCRRTVAFTYVLKRHVRSAKLEEEMTRNTLVRLLGAKEA